MAKDKEHYPHLEWLGYVQPVGLVVSAPALLAAQAHVTRSIGAEHQQYLASLTEDSEGRRSVSNLASFVETVLGWKASDLVDFSQPPGLPPELEVALPEYGETLAPTHATKQFVPTNAAAAPPLAWQLLFQSLPRGQDFDSIPDLDDRAWQATPQAKFERLLRETRVPIGLLFNHTAFRLVYAPRGETSGYMTFRVQDMAEPAGRPIFAAFHMLLSVERLVSLPEKQRLPAILESSRKYQNVVSTQLAGQVLQALFELVRGFQAADAVAKGKLLEQVLADDPNHVYHGLLTVLMRLVFILYAEDRNLLSADSVYANHYSLTGLFERLRSDAGRHHDTMNQRFGAWAQLLTLFRLIYDGGSHANLRIPPRHGYLFDPERYRFLEGRATPHDSLQQLPHVSDGVVYRVLEKLLILDGERLSYRTLDVEQIGSVYEAIMGFSLEIAEGRSIAIKAKKTHGAPATINLETLLATKATDRNKWLKEHCDQELSGKALEPLKDARSIDDLLAALDKKIAKDVTPNVAPTRSTGLRWTCTHGGVIFAAERRLKWPGLAAVVVSVVHIGKSVSTQSVVLDGREVSFISAYLFPSGGHESPAILKANEGKSFCGSKIYGQGFLFCDTEAEASPLSEMAQLIAKDPRNAERIFPYIGGEEINDSPTQSHRRRRHLTAC